MMKIEIKEGRIYIESKNDYLSQSDMDEILESLDLPLTQTIHDQKKDDAAIAERLLIYSFFFQHIPDPNYARNRANSAVYSHYSFSLPSTPENVSKLVDQLDIIIKGLWMLSPMPKDSKAPQYAAYTNSVNINVAVKEAMYPDLFQMARVLEEYEATLKKSQTADHASAVSTPVVAVSTPASAVGVPASITTPNLVFTASSTPDDVKKICQQILTNLYKISQKLPAGSANREWVCFLSPNIKTEGMPKQNPDKNLNDIMIQYGVSTVTKVNQRFTQAVLEAKLQKIPEQPQKPRHP